MEEAAESSWSVSSLPWAKLVPIDSRLCDVEIKLEEMVVKSATEDDGVEREWCKIVRSSERSSATIQNVSWSAIVVGGVVVEKGEEGVVRCGTEIVAAPHSQRGVMYQFKVMPLPLRLRPHQHPSQQLRIAVDADEAKCGICLSVWHDAVTLAPCFHNFCNGCFSEWLRHSHSGRVLCPHCRAIVQFAGRNHFLHNIAREILNADPPLRRSCDEVATLDASASIQSNIVIKTGNRNHRRKRPHSQSDEESHAMCPQCGSEFGGFHCNQNTIHLQCQACGGMMPSRPPLPQHCIGCDRAFCGAYWHAQGVATISSHATCSPHTFKPISERTVARIPFLAHEKNRHEQDITAKCIGDMGRRLEEVVAEWFTKLEKREIDRTGMGLNHADTITSESHVCNECYEKLVSFLLYCFRVALPKHVGAMEGREDCWYGHVCRTQHHNEHHARRRNHVCPPTRPSTSSTT